MRDIKVTEDNIVSGIQTTRMPYVMCCVRYAPCCSTSASHCFVMSSLDCVIVWNQSSGTGHSGEHKRKQFCFLPSHEQNNIENKICRTGSERSGIVTNGKVFFNIAILIQEDRFFTCVGDERC